jgi:hypothetical protein
MRTGLKMLLLLFTLLYQLLEYICEDNREYADEKGLQKIRLDPPGR